MLSINTQHGYQLGTDERNEAIKRALRLGLPHSYRQLAALFNCSETHVMHLSHLVEVEDYYKGYLASEGLPWSGTCVRGGPVCAARPWPARRRGSRSAAASPWSFRSRAPPRVRL
jgi:hypothetical protein